MKDPVSFFRQQHHRRDIGVPSGGKPPLQVLEGTSVDMSEIKMAACLQLPGLTENDSLPGLNLDFPDCDLTTLQ